MSTFVKKHYGGSRSGLFNFFIHISIFLRGSFSAITRLLKRKTGERDKEGYENIPTVIAGSTREYREVENLLEYAGRKENILGRIKIDEAESDNVIGSFDNLENVLRLHSIKEIIFCEGILSFKKIIETTAKIPKDISIQLFSNGSHAIIGSNDKKVAGNFILKNDN